MSTLAPMLESFFTVRLTRERQASPNTIAAYRDSFRLLLRFFEERLHKAPSELGIEDLDAPLIGAFLDHLETHRKNSARTRNARLSAIHSFFRYLAAREPAYSALIQRVLAIPQKRFDRALVTYLPQPEVEAILAAPNCQSWIGRRDHAIVHTGVQTGLRVSELTGLKREDAHLDAGAHVRCTGKGRKDRCTPLTRETVTVLRAWLKECPGEPSDPLFPSLRGGRLSRDAVAQMLHKYVARARETCPSLRGKRISPHVLRHTSAMSLLHAGVDRSVIALWLGHESIESTQMYIHADLSIKERAIARTAPLGIGRRRYRASDALIAFLDAL